MPLRGRSEPYVRVMGMFISCGSECMRSCQRCCRETLGRICHCNVLCSVNEEGCFLYERKLTIGKKRSSTILDDNCKTDEV